MHSHISIILNGENEYINDVSRSACEDEHKTGILQTTESHVVRVIKIKQTVTHSLMFAGYINSEVQCNGVGYSDLFGTWGNVVVQGTIKISLSEQIAEIKLNSNTIHLRSGTICLLSDGSYLDQEGRYTFWNTVPVDNCKFQQYSILYDINVYVTSNEETQNLKFFQALFKKLWDTQKNIYFCSFSIISKPKLAKILKKITQTYH